MIDRREEALELFRGFADQCGSEAEVLHFIESQTDVVPDVVRDWLADKRTPSEGIRKRVYGCLKSARPSDFPPKDTRLGDSVRTLREKGLISGG